MLPERLGSFEIKGLLGEGGSALVYAAHDGTRDLALKVLHADLCLDDRQVQRFLDEAERMRRVDHRALVPVLGAGCLPGGRPYIAMPRLAGRTLAARIAEAPVPAARALALFEDVAFGVAALHAAGLVHRDIKPENVFWMEPEDRLVLLDLGIARDSSSAPSTTTKAGFMRGTPAYMAPERLFGQPATVLSDIYELALLLCMMLTSKPPWDEGDAVGRMQPALRPEDRALVPPGVVSVLFEALSFEVTKRPPSVAALLGRIRRGFAGAAAATTLPSQLEQGALAHTPRVIVTPPVAAGAKGQVGPSEFGPTMFQPMTPNQSSPIVFADARHVSQMEPSRLAVASTGASIRPRSAFGSIATFVLGAGLAAGLAVGFVIWRDGRSAQASGRVEPDVTATQVPSETASAVAEPPVALSSGIVASALPSVSASAPVEALASASASSSSRSGGPIKEGVLPKSAIEPRLRARVGAMNGCVKSEAERPDFKEGRVVLNFWIGTSGNVTSVSGKSSDLPPAVVNCVAAQVRTIAFPAPEGGPVNVIFPIRFTAPKR